MLHLHNLGYTDNMTATINGVMVTGTPDEIAELIRKMDQPKISIGTGTPIYPIEPLRPYYTSS